jgi:hypothetical protein
MINFYSMEGCGFCKKAQAELKDEIALGKVNLKSAKEAPAGVTGFPHFTSSSGATHTGYLPKDQLLEKLGENIKEEYNKPPHHPHKPPHHPHKEPHHPHKPPHHPHHPPHQEPEICSKGVGGYLTLGQTWIKQKSYIA